MAVVNSDVLLLTQAGIKTEFNAAYIKANQDPEWKNIATEIPTTLPIQKYAWLGRGATMRLFADEVEAQSVVQATYTLADNTYVGDLVVDRRTLEDDQYGLIMNDAREMGQEPVRHWNELTYQGLANGFTAICYDGLSFFNSSHVQGLAAAQSNTTSNSLSDAALTAAEAAMMAYVDDKNKPLYIKPDTLVVGPALARKAADLCGSPINVTRVGDGTAGSGATAASNFSNYFNGRYRLIINPYLNVAYGNGYNWFLLDCSRGIKPIVIQSRQDVPITMETDMDQPAAKIKEKYQFTVRGRYVQGYGLWQTAYGSSASS
jgi:phage major head subunit gpT-like protein